MSTMHKVPSFGAHVIISVGGQREERSAMLESPCPVVTDALQRGRRDATCPNHNAKPFLAAEPGVSGSRGKKV